MKKLGIREIRKCLVGKVYHFATLSEDESRGFIEHRNLQISAKGVIKAVDKVESDPFGLLRDEAYTYLLTLDDDSGSEYSYELIEELITKGYIFQEVESSLSGISSSCYLIWADDDKDSSLETCDVFRYYAQNVMLGKFSTYEFVAKLAKKLSVSISSLYHYIDNSEYLNDMLMRFDWEHSDEFEKKEEYAL